MHDALCLGLAGPSQTRRSAPDGRTRDRAYEAPEREGLNQVRMIRETEKRAIEPADGWSRRCWPATTLRITDKIMADAFVSEVIQ